MGLLASCGKSSKVTLALNWKPEPEFGGFYAAPYSKYGLDVEVLPGGTGTPTIQMIGAGSVDFGIVGADELVIARARGNDVVALFATFQDNPAAIMTHASRKLTSLAQVFEHGTVSLQSGLAYARLLEQKYGFNRVKIVPSTGGDVSAFLNDENFAQQCFITAEPIAARHKGVEVTVFPISEIGFNPYSTIVATSSDSLRKNPERSKALVAAVREGWRAYLDDPKPANQKMQQINPSMDTVTFNEIAEGQKSEIETAETRKSNLGVMSIERWKTLIAQLKDLGEIPETIPAQDCFQLL